MAKQLISVLLITILLYSCSHRAQHKEILFVCTHGAAKSPVAAAYFNKMAITEGLNYKAIFRGTEPDEALSESTIEGLTNDGFDISTWKTNQVSLSDVKQAYKVISFDCKVPKTTGADEDQWNGVPDISKDYEIAREVIKGKVKVLIEDLKKA